MSQIFYSNQTAAQVNYEVNIQIVATPGMSVDDLGREMDKRMRQFAERQRSEEAARNRGRLGDLE